MVDKPTREKLKEKVEKPEGSLAGHELLIRGATSIRNAVDSSATAIGIADINGVSTYHNKAFVELTGYTVSQLNSKGGPLSLYADPNVGKQILGLVKTGKSWKGETEIVTRDGRICPNEVYADAITDDKGDLIGFIGIHTDITKRRQAEDTLQKSERRFRELTELLPEIVFEIDTEGYLTFVNQVAYENFGYTEEELYEGLKDLQMFVLKDRHRAKENMRRVLNGEDLGVVEYMAQRKDGSTFPVLVHSRAILDEKGNAVGLRGVMVNITKLKQVEMALRESENKFRSLFDLCPQPIALTEIETGKLIEVNAKFCELTKFTRKEVLGRTVTELRFRSEEDRNSFVEGLQKSREIEAAEKDFRIKDGSILHTLMFSKIIELAGKNRILSIFVDVTARKHLEKELLKSGKKYRNLVHNANSIILHWNRKGNIVFMNPYGLDFFGYNEDELIGRNVLGSIVPKTESTTQRALASLMENIQRDPDKYQDNENENMRKDGSRVWVRWTNKAVSDEQGNPVEILSVGNDVTARKQAEKSLQEKEERLRFCLEGSGDGTWEWDLKTSKFYLSERTKEMLGIDQSKREIQRSDLADFVDPDYLEYLDNTMKAIREGKTEQYSVEYPIMVNGHWKWMLSRGKVITSTKDGKPERMFGTESDITERKRSEAALKEREKELEVKSANLEEMNAALKVLLKNREEDKKELEEKILLNIRQMGLPYLEKLKKTDLDEKQATYLSILESNLNDIISPFLLTLFSKYSALTPMEIQVAHLVREGKRTKEIADFLHSSIKTVEVHRKSIRNKLGINNKKTNLRTHLLSFQ